MFSVLIPQPIDEAGLNYLRSNDCKPVFCGPNSNEVIESLKQCDGCVSKTFHIEAEWLANAPRVRVVGKHGTGYDNIIDIKAAETLGVAVVNTPLANVNAVAEHVIALMLMLAKRIKEMDVAVRAGDFYAPERTPLDELAGSILGIVGLGHIGSCLAVKTRCGLGMHVLGYDPFLQDGIEGVEHVQHIEELFQRADYISLHLPGGETTRGIISANLIAHMKPAAYLVNCARGSVIDQDALVAALSEGSIAGAALDVYSSEPLPPGHALTRLSNVILTPHSAALTHSALRLMSLQVCEGVIDVLYGRTPKWLVNRPEKRGVI